jgi:hypothetical protein
MNNFKLLLATAAMAVSGAAIAGPSYTYVDLGYVQGDGIDASSLLGGIPNEIGNFESDGFTIRGSKSISDNFHVQASYTDGDSLGGNGTLLGSDYDGYSIGVGYNPAITDSMDLVARIGYSDLDAEFGALVSDLLSIPEGLTDYSVSGINLEVGPRAMIGDNLELNAAATLFIGEIETIAGDIDQTDVGLRFGGEYYFGNISLGVDVETGFIDQANLHVRYTF